MDKYGFYKESNVTIVLGTVALVAITTALLYKIVIPAAEPLIKNISTIELAAIIALFVSIASMAVQLVFYMIRERKARKWRLEMQVEIRGNLANIACSYENVGTKRIIPKNVYLFIDQGVENEDGTFEFPFILRHEVGEEDCVLGKRCKEGGLPCYPQDLRMSSMFESTYCNRLLLKHLSSESIIYVDPGEKFSDSMTIRPPGKGVYRAMVVFTAVNADCCCTLKQFVIGDYSE